MFFELFFALVLSSHFALAAGPSTSISVFDVIPVRNAGLENIVIDSQITAFTGTNYTRINMHLGCFATNLRSVANSVNEFSMVTALVDLYDSTGTLQTYQLQFPAEFLKHPAARTYSQADMDMLVKVVSPTSGVFMKAYDNTIQLFVPHLRPVTLSSSGEVSNLAQKNLTLAGIRFLQGPIPDADLVALTASFTAAGKIFPTRYEPGQYVGYNGPLSSRMNWYVSNDTGSIDVTADFPGAARPGQQWGVQYQGFCGGFYSPLVLFFDEDLPRFTAKSPFSLFTGQTNLVHWPEAESKAYFLVLDKNGNGKVDDGTELFGDQGGYKNGFENLASYDLNRDGVIDPKDSVFNKLLLWYDKNADGVTQKDELISLKKMGIQSITLSYVNETVKFGDRAEYREKADFSFVKGKKKKVGKIVDIWLSSAGYK